MNEHFFRPDSCGTSHEGRVRELNEDRYLIDEDAGVWLVADGMGGHDAGEVASSAIVQHVGSIGKPTTAPDLRARFEDRVAKANEEIQRISAQGNGATMGSTLAALLAFEGQYACIWSGDSRVYLVRNGQISQVSRDHTEVQELIDRGLISQEEAKSYPRRNVITRAIGVSPHADLDSVHGNIHSGDTFVVCSDGLMAHVDDHEILEAVDGRSPETGCQILLDTTLERGATDNVTIVIVKFHNASGTARMDRWIG